MNPARTIRDPVGPPTYWLTRFVLLRLLGMVYAIAFLAAINQALPLIGSHGLLPAAVFLQHVSNTIGSTTGFIRIPSIFWFVHSDTALLVTAWIGFCLAIVVAAGFANAIIMTILWFFYMSFVNAGQEWYGYGWEIQLLETGFLAIFLCPLLDARPFPKRPPPLFIIRLFRWLILRIMVGSGLIKLRGDEVWRNATALYYHFETQPLPGPLSRWFHFLPRSVLRIGVWFNWLAELIAPLFVFWPRVGRHIAGIIMILLQIILILSGNLSFLNWLTIVPALACFDDGFLARVLPRRLVQKAAAAGNNAEPSRPMEVTSWIVTVLIAFLSIQPVVNMLSPNQIMNTSFDPLNLVFQGTTDSIPDDAAAWKEYSYKALPDHPDKRSPQIAPYQPRLDWQLWFAAMSTPDEYPWTLTLIDRLLHNDPGALSLFGGNPFPRQPPRYIRVILYRYKFAPPGNPQGHWWTRERIGAPWLPALSAEDPRLK